MVTEPHSVTLFIFAHIINGFLHNSAVLAVFIIRCCHILKFKLYEFACLNLRLIIDLHRDSTSIFEFNV